MLGLVLAWVSVGLGAVGVVLGYWFWQRPRAPKDSSALSHAKLRVEVSNHIPVFDHPMARRPAVIISSRWLSATARRHR